MTIEIYTTKNDQTAFRIKSRNGKIIATGESYKEKRKCEKTISRLQTKLAGARIVDRTEEEPFC